jgi:hypothetical protein
MNKRIKMNMNKNQMETIHGKESFVIIEKRREK